MNKIVHVARYKLIHLINNNKHTVTFKRTRKGFRYFEDGKYMIHMTDTETFYKIRAAYDHGYKEEI